jgi:hypothetical protein
VPLTLAQLRTAQTQADARARIIARLLDGNFPRAGSPVLPAADWPPSAAGGFENSTIDMVAGALVDLVAKKIVDLTSGRHLDLASGPWLTFLAAKKYKLARREATHTVQRVELASVAEAPPNDFAPGDLWVRAGSNRYTNLDRILLPPGDKASGRFRAENAGSSYADVEETIVNMVTAPPGVSCNNPIPEAFEPAVVNGSSTGLVFGHIATQAWLDSQAFIALGLPPPPRRGGGPTSAPRPSFGSVRLRILATGNVGTAQFEYSLDGGQNWITGGAVPFSPFLLGDKEAYLEFADGTNPSFIAGDIYTLLVGDNIVQRGRDEESDASLRERCRSRWPALSAVPTERKIAHWAQLASDEVERIFVDGDPTNPGGIVVTIATAQGPASPEAVIAVQDYITPRLLGYKGVPAPTSAVGRSPEEQISVTSATPTQITPAGIVEVPRAKVTAVQAASETAWLAYLRSVPIGGTVYVAELVQVVMDAGAVNFESYGLNGTLGANVSLATSHVAVPASGKTLANSLIWRPV